MDRDGVDSSPRKKLTLPRHPRSVPSLLDSCRSPLQIGVPYGAVKIDDGLLNFFEFIEIKGSLVNGASAINSRRRRKRDEIVEWVHGPIGSKTEPITDRHRR